MNLSNPDVVRLLVTETVKPSETTDAKAFIAVAIVAAESVVFNAAVVLVLNVTVNVPPVGYEETVAVITLLKTLAVAFDAVEST